MVNIRHKQTQEIENISRKTWESNSKYIKMRQFYEVIDPGDPVVFCQYQNDKPKEVSILDRDHAERCIKNNPERYFYKEISEAHIKPAEFLLENKNGLERKLHELKESFKIPDLEINEDDFIWLREVWRLTLQTGKVPRYRDIWANIHEKIGNNYNPRNIDRYLLDEKLTRIKLLGSFIVEDIPKIMDCANLIIKQICKEIREDAEKEDFEISEISKSINIDERWVQIVFTLISEGGDLWSSAGNKSTGDYFGYDNFSIKNLDTVNAYFTKADTIIENYIERLRKWRSEDLPTVNNEVDIMSSRDERNTEGYTTKGGLEKPQVFIVHGHDETAKIETARFIEKLGFEPIILHEQASSGNTIIEKIENYSNVGFGVVLYTPCDTGAKKGEEEPLRIEPGKT